MDDLQAMFLTLAAQWRLPVAQDFAAKVKATQAQQPLNLARQCAERMNS